MAELSINYIVAISTAGTIALCLCCFGIRCVIGERNRQKEQERAREALVASATAGVSATLGEPVVMA